MNRIARVSAIILVAPFSVAAQRDIHMSFEPSVVEWWTHTEIGGTTQELSGPTLGGDGAVSWGRWFLHLGYWQGSLQPGTSATAPRDVVEGYLLVGGRILPWLELKAGPHAWAYTANAGTQRWALFEARLRGQGSLIDSTLTTYFELWTALSGTVNASEPFGSGTGGQGGVTYYSHRWPVWGRLGYSIEQARLNGDVWKETVQQVTLGFGYAFR